MSTDHDDLERCLERAWSAYASGDLDRCGGYARQALQVDQHNGRAWQVLGCCQERQGRLRAADRSFLRAHRALHEPQQAPWRTTWRHFTQAVERAGERLPDALQHHLEEVDLVLGNYPADLVTRAAENPDCLGWFSGPTRSTRTADGEQPRIHLFRRPHEHSATNAAEFDLEVARTLYQELGRYLELTADEMDRLGLLG